MIFRVQQIEGYGTEYSMWCPGCDDVHAISDKWSFDGNLEKPTISPSILTWEGDWPEFPNPLDKRPLKKCHSFLREGRWEFLGDSTHSLAGKTADMVDLPDWLL